MQKMFEVMNRRDFLKISSVATFSMLFGDFKLIEAKNFSKKNRFSRACNFAVVH